MLLFLLSFYFQYDLLNCDENGRNAKFNESLIIDKHHHNLRQVNAFLEDVQQKILEKSVSVVGDYGNETSRYEEFVYDNISDSRRSKAPGIDQKDQDPKAHKRLSFDFHPSPQYDPFDLHQGLLHRLPPVFPGFKVPLPPLVIPRPSPPYPMALFPLKSPRQRPPHPGYLIRPLHSLYPRLPPRFLPDYRYQNIYLRPPGPYAPSPTKPNEPPFLYAVGHFLHKNPPLLNPFRPTISPPISDPAVSERIPPSVTIPSSTIRTPTMGHNAKIWLQEIAPYTPIKDQSPTAEINDYWFSTGTATTGLLFNEEHGFLYVTLPEKDVKPVNIPNDPNMNGMETTAGDVLHGKITVQKPSTPLPKQRYLSLMEQLDEGYMMVFMIELCRMIAVKDRREVREVLHHTEMIYNSLWDNGRLAWIGDPLETVIWKLSIKMSGRDVDLVRTYASMMFHMLLQRKQTLSAEVNSIIDEADLFYNLDEGDRLLYSLKQFEDYPKTTKNSYWLCDSLIESFLLPFRRLSGTRRRQRLMDSINKVLKQRFPLLFKAHNEGTLAGRSKNGSRKRKRKRHHLPYKMKHVRKGHRTPQYNNKNVYEKLNSQEDKDYKESILRTMTPVTSDQPRFRVVTTKRYRTKNKKNRRPSTAYFNLVTLSTRNRKRRYQKTTPFQKNLDSFDRNKSTKQTVHHHHYFSRKTSSAGHKPPPNVATSNGPVLLASSGFHSLSRSKRAREDKIPFNQMKEKLKQSEPKEKDKRLKLDAELLIKITESSSFSDEEVSLTKNLNEALKYGNRTVDFVDDTR